MGLETIATFRDVPAAELARSRLEADGIRAVLLDVHYVSMNWHLSQAVGGVRLQVPAAQAAAARDLLRRDRTVELLATPEAELPAAPDELCPRCGSEEVRPSSLARRSKAASFLVGYLLLGIPFVFWRNQLECGGCGFAWKRRRRPRLSPGQ